MKTKTVNSITGFLYLLLITHTGTVNAQLVIANAGNHFESGTIQTSWTLGEPVIATLSNSTYTITQGMHQGELITTVLEEMEGLDFEINAYPNPTCSYLNIYTQQYEDLQMCLFDIQGKLIISRNFEANLLEIDFSSLPVGTYIIHIVEDNNTIKKFQIIKK